MRAPITAVAPNLPATPAHRKQWAEAMQQPGIDAVLLVFDFTRALASDFALERELLATLPPQMLLRLGLSPWDAPADQGFETITLNAAPNAQGTPGPVRFMLSWTAPALAAYDRAWGNVKAFLNDAGWLSRVQSVRVSESSPMSGAEWGYCDEAGGHRFDAEWQAAGWDADVAVAGLTINMESLAAMFPGTTLSLTVHSPRVSGPRIDQGLIYSRLREYSLADLAVDAALAADIGDCKLVATFDSGTDVGEVKDFWTGFADRCDGLVIQIATANAVGDAGKALVAAQAQGPQWIEAHANELTAADLAMVADV